MTKPFVINALKTQGKWQGSSEGACINVREILDYKNPDELGNLPVRGYACSLGFFDMPDNSMGGKALYRGYRYDLIIHADSLEYSVFLTPYNTKEQNFFYSQMSFKDMDTRTQLVMNEFKKIIYPIFSKGIIPKLVTAGTTTEQALTPELRNKVIAGLKLLFGGHIKPNNEDMYRLKGISSVRETVAETFGENRTQGEDISDEANDLVAQYLASKGETPSEDNSEEDNDQSSSDQVV